MHIILFRNSLGGYLNLFITLPHMSISAGIVIPISFQKVYDTPHAKTCTDCDYKSF